MDNQNNNKKKRNIILPIFLTIIILIVVGIFALQLTGVIDLQELTDNITNQDEREEVDNDKDDSEDEEDKEESKNNTGSFFTPVKADIILTTACSNVDPNGEYYMPDDEFPVECKNNVCVTKVDGKEYSKNCSEENNNTEEPEQSEENNSPEEVEEEKEENNDSPMSSIQVNIFFDTACANLDPNGDFSMENSSYVVNCNNYVCEATIHGKEYTRTCSKE